MQQQGKQTLYSYSYEQRWYHHQPMPSLEHSSAKTKFLARHDVTRNL